MKWQADSSTSTKDLPGFGCRTLGSRGLPETTPPFQIFLLIMLLIILCSSYGAWVGSSGFSLGLAFDGHVGQLHTSERCHIDCSGGKA